MATNQAYKFEPEFIIAPGETLLETLEEMKLSQAEFALRTGRPLKTINGIIKGNTAITPETALQFEKVLDIPAGFWLNLENNYREAILKQQEREKLEQSKEWLKNFPTSQMIKMKWIEKKEDDVSQLEEILKFFKVASIKAWEDVWHSKVAFRKSQAFRSSPYAISAWLRQGEILADSLDLNEFNKEKFRINLKTIRELTLVEDPKVFIPELTKLCAEAGVAVIFLPELVGCRASGATKWINSKNPMILLSLRHKTNDHLWFTFFHEVGHILLHGKKMTFIEGIQGNNNNLEKEEEANKFSANLLIPKHEYATFIRRKPSKMDVIRFANQVGTAPGIIVGRLQKDKVIPYSYFNDQKVYYKWNNEK